MPFKIEEVKEFYIFERRVAELTGGDRKFVIVISHENDSQMEMAVESFNKIYIDFEGHILLVKIPVEDSEGVLSQYKQYLKAELEPLPYACVYAPKGEVIARLKGQAARDGFERILKLCDRKNAKHDGEKPKSTPKVTSAEKVKKAKSASKMKSGELNEKGKSGGKVDQQPRSRESQPRSSERIKSSERVKSAERGQQTPKGVSVLRDELHGTGPILPTNASKGRILERRNTVLTPPMPKSGEFGNGKPGSGTKTKPKSQESQHKK